MSLVDFYNQLCPKVSHEHRTSYNPLNNHYFTCILCVNNQERQTFVRYCDKYFSFFPVFTKSSENMARKIFTNGPLHLQLPEELQYIIFKMCWVEKKMNIPIHFNEKGLFHMAKCEDCASFIVKYINYNSCNYHIIPRFCLNQINYLVP
jgi:hypothetical protein